MLQLIQISGKVILVTGGGSGIGEAIVREFARQKAKVAFIDIAVESSRALHPSAGVAGTPVHFELVISPMSRAATDDCRNQGPPRAHPGARSTTPLTMSAMRRQRSRKPCGTAASP